MYKIKRKNKEKTYFTLLELLIVIAIIMILAGLLLPALKQVKNKARSIQCTSNLKQIGAIVSMYINDYNGWFPHAGQSHSVFLVYPDMCWKALLLAYLDKNLSDYNCEHGIFNCPAQENKSCGSTAYGDKGFYGGYGWNLQNLGWKDTNTSYPPWVNSSKVKNASTMIMAGDSSEFYLNTGTNSYPVFYIYGSDPALMATRHSGGGNYLRVDGHAAWNKPSEVYTNTNAWFKGE